LFNFFYFRYNECKEKLIPYLRKVGFNPKTDIYFMPVSGMTGAFLRDIPDESVCPWYRYVLRPKLRGLNSETF